MTGDAESGTSARVGPAEGRGPRRPGHPRGVPGHEALTNSSQPGAPTGSTLADAAATLTDDDRVAWYGPSMGSKSFLTARLMETWAHGQDIVDAVDADRPATDRLRHIAQLGFITRGWSYLNRGLEVPAGTVRLELTGPAGDTWVFGPDDADDVVTGDALDFCLVVTQRRHLDDTALTTGELGRDWLAIAQAFAGGATDGPAPR